MDIQDVLARLEEVKSILWMWCETYTGKNGMRYASMDCGAYDSSIHGIHSMMQSLCEEVQKEVEKGASA